MDVLGGELGGRVDVGEPGDGGGVVLYGGRKGGRHHAEIAHRHVGQADFAAFAGQEPAQIELFGRARIQGAELASLRVEFGITDEAVEQRVHAFI